MIGTDGDLTEMASAVCCSRLEEPKALMKMGLCVVLIGHVNFLLGALVHGVVLRHINLHKQARAMEYAISNVAALTSGLLGIIVGILAIVLSKNKRNRSLSWALFFISLASGVMAAGSAVGLLASVVRAVVHGGRSLLTHCRFPDAIGYSSITNECPFDPTKIYSTTLILWLPLIVTCVTQTVFSAQCLAACSSFLALPCCRHRTPHKEYARAINVVRPIEARAASTLRYTEAPGTSGDSEPPGTSSSDALLQYSQPPRRIYNPAPNRTSAPPRAAPPPPPLQQHHSLPLRQQQRQRSGREAAAAAAGTRVDGRNTPPEQHQLLERGSTQRSSFWI